MQVLNSALGGTLRQHLPDVVGHHAHRPEPGIFGECKIRLSPDSRTEQILGTEVNVSCHHHQAVDTPANNLTVVGTADDGTIEAVELSGHTFVLGVQWHPEQDNDDDRLVAALITAARTKAAR
jgi:gamma-glutamyl-gamma-aminobutyrate hydrolase PuuD